MKKDLGNELNKRGTAEISNGKVNQVTQAIDESPTKVKMLVFGQMLEKNIIPINDACAKCETRPKTFDTITKCQQAQKHDALARGFNEVICPKQFLD